MPSDTLAADWLNLTEWWREHGHRYNLSALARAVGTSKSTLSILLRDPTARHRRPTPELLASLTAELAKSYSPPAPLS